MESWSVGSMRLKDTKLGAKRLETTSFYYMAIETVSCIRMKAK
jgi:hypothetical protein